MLRYSSMWMCINVSSQCTREEVWNCHFILVIMLQQKHLSGLAMLTHFLLYYYDTYIKYVMIRWACVLHENEHLGDKSTDGGLILKWPSWNRLQCCEMAQQIAIMNIPHEWESRHQIWHATVQLLNTVLFHKLSIHHFWDNWLYCVRTVQIHIHNPVPCVMMLNIPCSIMECPVCML